MIGVSPAMSITAKSTTKALSISCQFNPTIDFSPSLLLFASPLRQQEESPQEATRLNTEGQAEDADVSCIDQK